jgi:hypothetical protein
MHYKPTLRAGVTVNVYAREEWRHMAHAAADALAPHPPPLKADHDLTSSAAPEATDTLARDCGRAQRKSRVSTAEGIGRGCKGAVTQSARAGHTSHRSRDGRTSSPLAASNTRTMHTVPRSSGQQSESMSTASVATRARIRRWVLTQQCRSAEGTLGAAEAEYMHSLGLGWLLSPEVTRMSAEGWVALFRGLQDIVHAVLGIQVSSRIGTSVLAAARSDALATTNTLGPVGVEKRSPFQVPEASRPEHGGGWEEPQVADVPFKRHNRELPSGRLVRIPSGRKARLGFGAAARAQAHLLQRRAVIAWSHALQRDQPVSQSRMWHRSVRVGYGLTVDPLAVAIGAVMRSFLCSSPAPGQHLKGVRAVLADWLWQQAALVELRMLPQPQLAALANIAAATQPRLPLQKEEKKKYQLQCQQPLPQHLRLLAAALSPGPSSECSWAQCIGQLIAWRRVHGKAAEWPPGVLIELRSIHAAVPLRPSQVAQLWAVSGIRL